MEISIENELNIGGISFIDCTFNQNQLNWLARIEKTMLEEPVLDESLFDQGAYRTNGGFNAINKRFGGTLRAIIQEINQYIYDDGGSVA